MSSIILKAIYTKKFVKSVEANLKRNSKCFWKFINSKRKSNGLPKCMKYSGKTSDNLKDICNLFAEYFKSVYCSENIYNFNTNHTNSSSVLDIGHLVVTEDEVENSLKALVSNRNPGPDGFPAIVLKFCARSLAKPLTMLFNMSLSCGVFLNDWKISFVSPIFKSGSKHEITNYRPICKMASIPKIFEKILYQKLLFHVKEIISVYQHGFFAGRSTTTNLTILCNDVVKNFEDNCQTDIIFTDFAKAFDKVNHKVLIWKLSNLGFHSVFLKWVESSW